MSELVIQDVWKEYGDQIVLENVSLTVASRAFVALVGPSGCGKSTFLRCFNRMHDLYPGNRYEGTIVLQPDNTNLLEKAVDPIEVRMRIGMVFQKPNPFPKSIYENVAYGLRIRGVRSTLRRQVGANHRMLSTYVNVLRGHGLVIDERGIRLIEDAGRVVRELGTPWTNLLAELEVASRDTQGQIAVLSVEPDHEKHRVHITGESRDLPLALAYVRRLQSSRALRYPMLDSHEVRADDAQRPVRFAMTAEWSGLP